MENFKQKLTAITDKINAIEKPTLKEMIEAIRSHLPELENIAKEAIDQHQKLHTIISLLIEYKTESRYATDINLGKIDNQEEEDSKIEEMWSRISRFQDKMLSEL